MNEKTAEYRNRWWQRVLSTRRRYFFHYLTEAKQFSEISLPQLVRWIFDDFKYVTKWSINIFLQLRAYGFLIRKRYRLPLWQQFTRMSYLAFVLQVDPSHLRGRQLYRPECWRHVKKFTYAHSVSQYQLSVASFPDEILLLQDKFRFYEFCRSKNIYSPEIIGVFRKGQSIWPGNPALILPHNDLIVKHQNGKAGQGINKFTYSAGFFHDGENNRYTVDDLVSLLCKQSLKTNIILQESVINHPEWQRFTSGALATCRIVTGKSPENGSIIPLLCSLRMPVGKAVVDNFSKGGFYSSVDLETGVLTNAIGLKPVNKAFDFENHPDTGQKIAGTVLPFWEDLLEFTVQVHTAFKTIFVGWDIAMTSKGCCVVEGNIGWASRSYESPQKRPLGESVYPELYEKWMEKYSATATKSVNESSVLTPHP